MLQRTIRRVLYFTLGYFPRRTTISLDQNCFNALPSISKEIRVTSFILCVNTCISYLLLMLRSLFNSLLNSFSLSTFLFFRFCSVSAFIKCAIRFFRFLDEQNNLYIQSYNGSVESYTLYMCTPFMNHLIVRNRLDEKQ